MTITNFPNGISVGSNTIDSSGATLPSLTVSTDGAQVNAILSATSALNFGSIAAGASADLTISVTGAVAGSGSTVMLGLPPAPTAGIVYQGFVSSTDTVTVRATNITGSSIDPTAQTFRVAVFDY